MRILFLKCTQLNSDLQNIWILISKILWLTFAVWLYIARGKGLNQLFVMTVVRIPELHQAAFYSPQRLISVNKSPSLWQQTDSKEQGVHNWSCTDLVWSIWGQRVHTFHHWWGVQSWSGQSELSWADQGSTPWNLYLVWFAELTNEIWSVSCLVYQNCLTVQWYLIIGPQGEH